MIQTDENSDRQSQAIRYQNWISQLLAFGEYIPIVEKAFVWIFVSFEVSWRNRKFSCERIISFNEYYPQFGGFGSHFQSKIFDIVNLML